MSFIGWTNTKASTIGAQQDALTGLLNRIGLLEHLEDVLASSRRANTTTAVFFCDLDRFKVINDSMGHDVGDELLCAVGERIARVVRTSDQVARFGGDEFVVVCDGLMEPGIASTIASQILKAFEKPIPLSGGGLVVVPSIGIATSSDAHRRTASELLRDSDAAMYRAKRSRSGFAVFDDEQRRTVMARLDVERSLRDGLENGELTVYYQPIVNQESHLSGLEALVRWNRPGMGVVSPGGFLGVAEEAGLMASIGEYVLREACAQAALWSHRLGTASSVHMGVNVAEPQLVDASFPARVEEVLKWAGLPAEQLMLEITEDLMLGHLDDSFRVLHEFKELGVRLAIDDFGTGRSSLSYIKQLDMVDILKIDKSFVDDIATRAVDLQIIEAIASLAHAVGLRVIAEGVETNDQRERLRALGIENMQGFLFARPSTASELERILGIPGSEAAAVDDGPNSDQLDRIAHAVRHGEAAGEAVDADPAVRPRRRSRRTRTPGNPTSPAGLSRTDPSIVSAHERVGPSRRSGVRTLDASRARPRSSVLRRQRGGRLQRAVAPDRCHSGARGRAAATRRRRCGSASASGSRPPSSTARSSPCSTGPARWTPTPRARQVRQPRTSSFPSGHASAAAMAATLLADRSRAPALWYGVAAVVATSRIHVSIHHASDVVAGAAVGLALGRVALRVWPLPADASAPAQAR